MTILSAPEQIECGFHGVPQIIFLVHNPSVLELKGHKLMPELSPLGATEAQW